MINSCLFLYIFVHSIIHVSESGTTPHAPTNVTVNTSSFDAKLTWLPGYDGDYKQSYLIWYRLAGQDISGWRTVRALPEGSTTVTLYYLHPDTEYEFQVQSRNILGDGLFSPIVKAQTKTSDYLGGVYPTDAYGVTYIPRALKDSVSHKIFVFGKLRHLLADTRHSNRTHNNTKNAKVAPSSLKEGDSVVGTEAAVLFIVVIVVLSVIGMVIYFIRKFDQLNRSLPTYRYSSLKTEINGYGPDDKNESQALVSVSTEEEDDYDEEEQDLEVSPPTLLVRSQTVMSSKAVNGSLPVVQDGKIVTSGSLPKSGESSVDSDDELLQ